MVGYIENDMRVNGICVADVQDRDKLICRTRLLTPNSLEEGEGEEEDIYIIGGSSP